MDEVIPQQAETKKVVLLVEDDLFLQKILAQKLEKGGFIVERALEGKEAFDILEKKHIDIVLLDLLLPGMDGKEWLQQVRKDQRWKDLPVIVASNLDNATEREATKDLGAVDYLVKADHTPDEIVERVKREFRG